MAVTDWIRTIWGEVRRQVPENNAVVPSVVSLIIAGEVVKDLMRLISESSTINIFSIRIPLSQSGQLIKLISSNGQIRKMILPTILSLLTQPTAVFRLSMLVERWSPMIKQRPSGTW